MRGGNNNQICKFFLSGSCKFGDSCKFQHIINTSATPQRRKSQDLIAATTTTVEQVIKYDFGIHIDWPFSCYGLVLDWKEGKNLISGEFSPEELRAEAYMQQRTLGNIRNYETQVNLQKKLFEVRKNTILANPQKAISESAFPNRMPHVDAPQVIQQPTIQIPNSQVSYNQKVDHLMPEPHNIQQAVVPQHFVPTLTPISNPTTNRPVDGFLNNNPTLNTPNIFPHQQSANPNNVLTSSSFEFGKIPEDLMPKTKL